MPSGCRPGPTTPATPAGVVGLSAVTVRAVRHRWNARRPDGVAGRRARYEWVHVDGFARPATGGSLTALLPRVSVGRPADALAAFAAHADPDGQKVLVVVVDSAGWPTARRPVVPPNVRLHVPPPCTPELPPVEPYWSPVREAGANETYDRPGDLRRVVRRPAEDRAAVLGAIGFRWATRLER